MDLLRIMQEAHSEEKHPFSSVEEGSRTRYDILPKLLEYIVNVPQQGEVGVAVQTFTEFASVKNLDRLLLCLFASKASSDRHDHAVGGYFRYICWKNDDDLMTMDELTDEFGYFLHLIRLFTFREIQKNPERKADILQMVNPK